MRLIGLLAYLLFASSPASSQNTGGVPGGGGVSCCVDLSTPSCAAALAYCRNSTLPATGGGSLNCQSLICSKTASPSPAVLRPSQTSQPIRTSVPPSKSAYPPRPSMSATETQQRLRQSNSQTQTPSVVAVSSSPSAYPSNTATATVYIMPSSSATGTPTGSGLAPTPAPPSSAATGTGSGTGTASATATATATSTRILSTSPSPTPSRAVVAAPNGINSAPQAAPLPPDSGVVPANAIAGAAVAACVLMAAVVGGYMVYKHRASAQRNLIKRTIPTIQTINPAAVKHHESSFRPDPRVAFKPIKSARSFSV